MTIDKAKLKALAEAVNESYAALCEHGGDELAEAWHSAELAYDDAANPVVVLALLAEIELLEYQAESRRRLHAKECVAMSEVQGDLIDERDQLKAENEALRKDAERYRWLRDKQTFIWLIQDWFPSDAAFTDVDGEISAAMAKEASHG